VSGEEGDTPTAVGKRDRSAIFARWQTVPTPAVALLSAISMKKHWFPRWRSFCVLECCRGAWRILKMKIHLFPPLPPASPPLPERLRPTQLQAELAASELIEIAERRKSERTKLVQTRDDKRRADSDRRDPQTKRKRDGIDVLV
jgi:hypothetical protein